MLRRGNNFRTWRTIAGKTISFNKHHRGGRAGPRDAVLGRSFCQYCTVVRDPATAKEDTPDLRTDPFTGKARTAKLENAETMIVCRHEELFGEIEERHAEEVIV